MSAFGEADRALVAEGRAPVAVISRDKAAGSVRVRVAGGGSFTLPDCCCRCLSETQTNASIMWKRVDTWAAPWSTITGSGRR